MKKLFIAALMGCAAMPAQAYTYVRYEATGTANGLIYDNQNQPTAFSNWDLSAYALVPVDCLYCWTGPTRITLGTTSVTATTTDAFSAFSFTLNFDEPLSGFPLTNEHFVGGVAQPDVFGQGIGYGTLTQLRVTTFSSDEMLRPSAFATVARPVPEPATWAMMIAGFSLAGAALRKRKTAIQFA